VKEGILSVFIAFIGLISVLILTYYASRWYAKKQGTVSGGKHIKIVDRILVGKSGSVMIIDVEGRQYLIGANEQSISIMKELEEPIDLKVSDMGPGGRFKDHLKSYLHKGKRNG
jgi:flagellar protein FliO/FliZ